MKTLAAVLIVAAGVVPGLVLHIGAVGAGGRARALGSTTALAEARDATSDALLDVTYRDGFLTVHCANTALDELFARVAAATGIRLVGQQQSVRMCRSTTIQDQPLAWALDRLLTDHGLSYALVLAPTDEIVTVHVFDSGQRVQPAPPRPVRRIPGHLRRWPVVR